MSLFKTPATYLNLDRSWATNDPSLSVCSVERKKSRSAADVTLRWYYNNTNNDNNQNDDNASHPQ